MSHSLRSKKGFKKPDSVNERLGSSSYLRCMMPMVVNAEIVGPNAATPMRAKGGVVLELCNLRT